MKNTVHCLLTPAECMLWDRLWKIHLITLSDGYSKDANRPNFTAELAGEGNFQKPTDQAQLLPETTLQDTAITAKISLFLTPDTSLPTQNFANIKPGAKDSFIEFVDRLKYTLEKHIESSKGRKEVLNKIAMANANPECKAILRLLPLDSELTTEQMVEACTSHTSTEDTVAQAVAKGIAGGVAGAFAVVAAKDNQRCFCCGELGHFLKDCLDRATVQDVVTVTCGMNSSCLAGSIRETPSRA